MGTPPHKSSNQRETELQSVTYRKAVCLVSFLLVCTSEEASHTKPTAILFTIPTQKVDTASVKVIRNNSKKYRGRKYEIINVRGTMQAHRPSGFVPHWPWMSSHQISQLSRAANPKTNTTKSFRGLDLKWPLGQKKQTKHDFFFSDFEKRWKST